MVKMRLVDFTGKEERTPVVAPSGNFISVIGGTGVKNELSKFMKFIKGCEDSWR
jgi:hypothetical protein